MKRITKLVVEIEWEDEHVLARGGEDACVRMREQWRQHVQASVETDWGGGATIRVLLALPNEGITE